jgi:hypothetical protein
MKKNLLLPVLCGAVLLTACEYDDHDHAVRHVSVSTDSPYYGDYDEYSPYYSYSGRRYYRTGNRYVYYQDRRPYYVTSLPTSAVYMTPSRSTSSTFYGDYDEYSPYYSYSGRRYYRTGNRYVYYQNRRPYYETSLPSAAVYVTPPRSTTTNVRVVRHRDNDD